MSGELAAETAQQCPTQADQLKSQVPAHTIPYSQLLRQLGVNLLPSDDCTMLGVNCICGDSSI